MTANLFAGTARPILETGREPEEMRVMIGARTLKEGEAASLLTRAYCDAFDRSPASEKRLTT